VKPIPDVNTGIVKKPNPNPPPEFPKIEFGLTIPKKGTAPEAYPFRSDERPGSEQSRTPGQAEPSTNAAAEQEAPQAAVPVPDFEAKKRLGVQIEVTDYRRPNPVFGQGRQYPDPAERPPEPTKRSLRKDAMPGGTYKPDDKAIVVDSPLGEDTTQYGFPASDDADTNQFVAKPIRPIGTMGSESGYQGQTPPLIGTGGYPASPVGGSSENVTHRRPESGLEVEEED